MMKKEKKEKYVLCGACKKPIYQEDLGSISKDGGFRHKNCATARLKS